MFKAPPSGRRSFTFYPAVTALALEQKGSALVGTNEVTGGVGLVLEEHAVDLNGLLGTGRVGKAAADGTGALGDRQSQFVRVFRGGAESDDVLRGQGDLIGD